MTISFFLTFHKLGEPGARVIAAELARVSAIVSDAPGAPEVEVDMLLEWPSEPVHWRSPPERITIANRR